MASEIRVHIYLSLESESLLGGYQPIYLFLTHLYKDVLMLNESPARLRGSSANPKSRRWPSLFQHTPRPVCTTSPSPRMFPLLGEIWGPFHRSDCPDGSHHRATHWRCIDTFRPANTPINIEVAGNLSLMKNEAGFAKELGVALPDAIDANRSCNGEKSAMAGHLRKCPHATKTRADSSCLPQNFHIRRRTSFQNSPTQRTANQRGLTYRPLYMLMGSIGFVSFLAMVVAVRNKKKEKNLAIRNENENEKAQADEQA
ncbi:hypothetical protein K438DRAFT_1768998 [Mycena galopus ATCC 62051]|nr:hypothetical protein K438DRAFT_1768998 [Mycena galopus ATCC 62051]